MSRLKNERLLRALRREPVDRTPVWVMRQAGRHLPEYRQIRQQVDGFMTLCQTPELACEVTLQPLARYDLDAAILFSDILTIPDALGLGLGFFEGEGPKFAKPIQDERSVASLPTLEIEKDLSYVLQAIEMIKKALAGRVPLIGFAGSPWTVATYMVEGQSSKNFSKIKKMLFANPACLHKLLSHVALETAKYLQAQVNAGCDCVMLFDTWGGVLSEPLYLEFSLAYMAQIVRHLKLVYPDVPVTVFTKNGGQSLLNIAESGCDAIGLDWGANLTAARRLVGNQVALQGNMDPCVLYSTPERIEAEVKRVLEQYGTGPGHIFNLGHGIHPDVSPDNMVIMINAVKQFSPSFHTNTEMV